MAGRKRSKTKSSANVCKGNSKENINSNISMLDDDSLRHVFTFLPAEDRIRIQRVCKRWQRVSKLPWNDVKSLDCNFNLDYEKALLLKLPNIKKILAMSGKYLDQLILPFVHVASTTVLVKLVKKTCPNLRSISFLGLTITRSTAQFLIDNFKDFTEIKLGDCWPGCEDLISEFLSKNTNLRSIVFRGCWRMNGSCMRSLPAESLNEIIIMNGDRFSPRNVYDAFQNFRNLRLLKILESDKLLIYIDQYLDVLPNKSSLETLILRCGTYRPNRILHMEKLGLCVNLRKIFLSGNYILNDQVLITIGAHCKNLLEATLDYSDGVTDVGIQSLIDLPKLEQLAIHNLDNVTENSFDRDDNPSLKILRCYDCINIGAGLDVMLLAYKNLQRLDVVGCEDVVEESLIRFAKVLTFEREPKEKKVLELYFLAEDGPEEVIDVSPNLRILRKKEEFFFGGQ